MPARTILFIASAVFSFGIAAFVATSGGNSTERFENAAAVVDALEREGVECYDYKRLDAPQESILDFGLCFLTEGHEFETDIYVFDDTANRDAWIASFDGKVGMVVGTNWFITNGSEEELATLQEALGGEIR